MSTITKPASAILSANKKYYVIVASKDHVMRGKREGFCQACHGKKAPLTKMKAGDGVVFYSPKLHFQPKLAGKAAPRAPKEEQLRAFTAIGYVDEKEPYAAPDMPAGFWRRNVVFSDNLDAPIGKLINQLEFTRVASPPWGLLMRRGFFEISRNDFEVIASNMIKQEN